MLLRFCSFCIHTEGDQLSQVFTKYSLLGEASFLHCSEARQGICTLYIQGLEGVKVGEEEWGVKV